MAVTVHTSATIRGISYNQGDSFVCAYAGKGNGGSEGDGTSAAALTVGKTYYFLGYVTADDSGSNVVYPYRIGSSSSTSSAIGYYKAEVFPYATYRVTFNANGGSLGSVPSYQTKTYGTTLTLTTAKPTRSGYTFVGWGISSTDTTVDYNAGGSYTANAADTLYAIWKKTITLTYDANGGSGAPSSQSADVYNATMSKTFTLSSTYPTRIGYTFKGWSKSSTATVATYAPNGSIALSSSDTLYAVWSENVLTVNYYSNYADYGTYKGEALSVSASTNVLVHSQDFLYDNSYSSALSNVQNSDYLYLSRTGYHSTGYWGTSTEGGTLIDEDADYTGQALAKALGKDLSNGNASINMYPQWNINIYFIYYNSLIHSNAFRCALASIRATFAGGASKRLTVYVSA